MCLKIRRATSSRGHRRARTTDLTVSQTREIPTAGRMGTSRGPTARTGRTAMARRMAMDRIRVNRADSRAVRVTIRIAARQDQATDSSASRTLTMDKAVRILIIRTVRAHLIRDSVL